MTWQNYTATGGSTTTLVDNAQSWPINGYQASFVCNVTRGTYAQVTSNTATTLHFAAMGTANQAGDVYSLNGENMVSNVGTGGDSGDGLHPGPTGRRAQRIWTAYNMNQIGRASQ